MKWFKHDSCASMDAKLQEVLLDYGLEGYGLYWYCLELISANVDHTNLTFELEHDARIIARNTGNTVQRVEEMMRRFIELNLFESSKGVITCIKLGRRCDEYTSKLLRNSGQNPDTLRTKSLLIEKNRIEQSRTDKNKDLSSTSKKVDSTPYLEIVNLYHKHFDEKPKVKKLTTARKTHIRARWNEVKKKGRGVDYFDQFFLYASGIPFLKNGSFCDLEWLMKEGNHVKVIEGKYEDD